MEPPGNPHRPRPRSAEAISVAELLARCQGAPVPPPSRRGTGDAVSVAALLRREGRGPHRADPPLLPRGYARVAQPPAEPPRRNVRKAAAAAGALFAATAVLGPSVLDDASVRSVPDAGIPLPLPGLHGQGPGAHDLAVAAVRQLFADAVPSAVDTTAVADGEAAGRGRIAAHRSPSTVPGRAGSAAGTGSTEPIGVPWPGTVPPGSGVPPAGPGSWPPGGGGTGPAGPGGGSPGGEAPGGGAPGGGAPGGGGEPSRPPVIVVALSPPEVATPAVRVPSAAVDLPVAGPVRTPEVTVGPAVVAAPDVRATLGADGVEAVTTATGIGLPDVTAGDTNIGPLAASGASITTPDVEVSGARLALTADEPPEVELPEATLSATRVETPDLALGAVEVELPDIELPSVRLGLPSREEDEDTSPSEPVESPADADRAETGSDDEAGTEVTSTASGAESESGTESDTETDRERDTETHTDTARETDTETDTETDEETETETESETDEESAESADESPTADDTTTSDDESDESSDDDSE
ncbi:hypothetical protein [Pseudonocardia cypriaca]|uniref:hypothetical protein n=1 Tax=Pseudonocardia cypriaca TaxID=882449 RepID=UPI001B86A24B|nr:hypothetical protein [Pseudonocardia cypriaca]